MAWNMHLRKPRRWTLQADDIVGSCGLDLDEAMIQELPVWDPNTPPTPPLPFRPGGTPAASEVLQEPCLIEMILIEVDIKTLLLSQRVSIFWKATIQNTTKLQKKLFLKPATIDDLIPLRMAGRRDTYEHGCDFVVPPREDSTKCPPNDFVQINHLLNTPPLQHMRDHNHSWVRLRLPDGLDPTQSWNRMFATQPPVRVKTIREVLTERREYEQETGKKWVTPGMECKMHLWVKGYAVSVNSFRNSIDRRDKQRVDLVVNGKKWKDEDEQKVLQRRAEVFNRLPYGYTLSE